MQVMGGCSCASGAQDELRLAAEVKCEPSLVKLTLRSGAFFSKKDRSGAAYVVNASSVHCFSFVF